MTLGDLGRNLPIVNSDPANLAFYDGRQFHSYLELNIPASTTQVIRLITPIDIIITWFEFAIELGLLRAALIGGGQDSGVFGTPLSIHSGNQMSLGVNRRIVTINPNAGYEHQVALATGGGVTGGTEADLVRLKAGSNVNRTTSVINNPMYIQGLAASTYHFKFQNLDAVDAVIGVFKFEWEERPVD
jgi:hypothetical protein